MLALFGTLLLGAGLVGYVLAFTMIVRMQRWLGRRGGWPAILLGALARLLGLLALLFALSLAGRFAFVRHSPPALRLVLAYGTVVALVAAPWVLAYSLHRWRRQAERGRGIE